MDAEGRVAYVKTDDILIPIFNGTEYDNWKTRMFMFLKMKKCLDVVKRERNGTDQENEWKENQLRATNYIFSAVANKQFERIKSLDTPLQMIKKFDDEYQKTSTALQIIAWNNLERIKLKNYTNPGKFFDEFGKAVNDVKEAGATLSEPETLNYMTKALPSSLSYLGDLIDVSPEQQRTVEFLKSKMKTKMMERRKEMNNAERDSQNSNALNTEANTRTCIK